MAFLVLFVGTVSNLEAVVSGLPRWFDYLMLVPWAMVGLTVIMLLLTPMVWARRYWSRRGGSTIRCWWSGGRLSGGCIIGICWSGRGDLVIAETEMV